MLALGTLATSTAAPFIKLAYMHPMALAAGRLLGAGVIYGLIGRDFVAGWRSLSPQDRRRLVLASPLMTGHFACWMASLSFTDLPSAVLLLVLQPLLATFFGARVFRERVTRGIVLALVLALAGLGLIVYDDLRLSARYLVGDGLVALGALFIIAFFTVGRRLRPLLSFPAYMCLTYGGAGVWALALALVFGIKLVGYPAAAYGWLAGLILITTGVGHAALNYALPYARLFTVNLVTIAEPVLAIAAAVMFLGEGVTVGEIAGGVLLMAALLVGMRDEMRPTRETAVPGPP